MVLYESDTHFQVSTKCTASHFAILEVVRRFLQDDSLDDASAHAFDDWFARAAATTKEGLGGLLGTKSHSRAGRACWGREPLDQQTNQDRG